MKIIVQSSVLVNETKSARAILAISLRIYMLMEEKSYYFLTYH